MCFGENMTRMLLLMDYQLDYGAEFLLHGLYKVLGKENITIFPFLRRYTEERVDKDYILPDGSKGFTALPEQLTPLDLEEKDFDEIIAEIRRKGFDYIVMASPREYVIKSMEMLKKEFGNIPLPVVFCDFEDYSMLRWDIVRKYNPICYFKRELLDTDENRALMKTYPLFPLPFAAMTDKLAPDILYDKKDIDVFFSAGLTHPFREKVVRLLYELKDEGINFVGGVDPQPPDAPFYKFRLGYREYQEFIGRSKINITARGFGYDTVRRWEAPCYLGLVLADKIPLITPYSFTDGANIVYYENDLTNFKVLVKYYLEHEEEAKRIGMAGREYVMKYHTTEARARYFLKILEGWRKSKTHDIGIGNEKN